LGVAPLPLCPSKSFADVNNSCLLSQQQDQIILATVPFTSTYSTTLRNSAQPHNEGRRT
jgi:hypothetical protein